MDKDTYKKYAERRAKKSPCAKNCLFAFLVGGAICFAGQALGDFYGKVCSLPEETAGTLVSVTLIFCAVLLTGFGVFDKIAQFAGAGTLVPITGFANAVASPAIDARTEGLVTGVGVKIFTVAGPVILFGTATGALYGIVLWVLALCGVTV